MSLRSIRHAACRVAACVVILSALVPIGRPQGKTKPAPPTIELPPSGPTDEELHRAWSFLLPGEQLDAAEWLRAEASHLDSFQLGLITYALGLEKRDLGTLPVAPPTPVYDPAVHAPRQVIPRTPLEPDDPRAVAERERLLGRTSAWMRCSWRYDWSIREVVRTGDDHDPTTVFENAIRGYPPDADIAQALIERALDDGSEQKLLTAFAHAYTDRSGTVYPGVTLYDAWSSGADMEMPDVDTLGIVHDIDDDWKKWVAPVAAGQQEKLYAHIGDLFVRARRYRGLRQALAATYVIGSAPLRDAYAGHRDRLHSLWDVNKSTPEDVLAKLPDAKKAADFLEKWSAKVDRDVPLTQAGLSRRGTLDRDSAAVRATMIRILKEMGALERTSRPEPKHPDAPAQPHGPPKDGR